jgi:hypothetical protein
MVFLSAVASGDPLSWTVLVFGALVFGFWKLIGTVAKIARIELWARFSERHRSASKGVRKLIEQASQDDLHERPSHWRRPDISK